MRLRLNHPSSHCGNRKRGWVTDILHYDTDIRQEDNSLKIEIPTLISEAKLFHMNCIVQGYMMTKNYNELE